MLPRMRLIHVFPCVAIVLFLAACTGQEETAELPTLMSLPTLTPSDTPTNTLTPTNTPTPTPTSTPTNTPTNTPTPTLTPSLTFTPSTTPTLTQTPTSTPTFTPTFTPTPATPQIKSYVASSTSVPPNTQITLTWETSSDATRIEQQNSQGATVFVFSNLPPAGSLAVTVPSGQGNLVIYKLVASRGGQEAASSIPITVQCPIAWFFGNQRAPAGSGCPTAVGAIAAGNYQLFQNGLMIYVTANGLNKVFGLQNLNNLYISYTSAWDGSTVYNCAGAPPGGFFAPGGVFDWAYCNTNAPIGTWNSAIGWAVIPLDSSARTIQFSDNGMFFIDVPGGLYRFTPASAGAPNGTWMAVP